MVSRVGLGGLGLDRFLCGFVGFLGGSGEFLLDIDSVA